MCRLARSASRCLNIPSGITTQHGGVPHVLHVLSVPHASRSSCSSSSSPQLGSSAQCRHYSKISRGSISCCSSTESASSNSSSPGPHTSSDGEPPSSNSSILGCALLVAGTAVGAGMLALPAVTAPAGFPASAAALIVGDVYSITTGLLIAEATLNSLNQQQAGPSDEASEPSTGSTSSNSTSSSSTSSSSTSSSSSISSSSSSPAISLLSVVRGQLGGQGAALVGAPYIFLHYSLLVAYIAKGGEVIGQALGMPLLPAATLFTAGIGGCCYALSAGAMDTVNGALVAVVGATFLGLLGLAATDVDPQLLSTSDWAAVVPALPVVALAFVYQNVVPVVVQRLDRDPVKVRSAIVLGAMVPLPMFLLWEAAILGSVPGHSTAGGLQDPLLMLQAASPAAAPLIATFSFTAVATSFVGFVLSLTDFVGDALNGQGEQAEQGPASRPQLYLMVLLPPLAFALLNPHAFLSALDYAGTYGVMSLFGVLPAVLCWQQRYGYNSSSTSSTSGTCMGEGTSSTSGTVIGEGASSATAAMLVMPAQKRDNGPAVAAMGTPAVASEVEVLPGSSSRGTMSPSHSSGTGTPAAQAVQLEIVPGGRPMLVLIGAAAAGIIVNQACIHVERLVTTLSG